MPPNKQTTATVAAPAAPMPVADNGFGGGLQQEDQLEDSLYELDQLHLQVSTANETWTTVEKRLSL